MLLEEKALQHWKFCLLPDLGRITIFLCQQVSFGYVPENPTQNGLNWKGMCWLTQPNTLRLVNHTWLYVWTQILSLDSSLSPSPFLPQFASISVGIILMARELSSTLHSLYSLSYHKGKEVLFYYQFQQQLQKLVSWIPNKEMYGQSTKDMKELDEGGG